MRDEGYDFFHYDQHCPNVFAGGYEADISGSVRYELVTAFEVFEHIPEPAKTVAHLLSMSDSILFSTELLPVPAPPIVDWWYYGPERGQHIAFFTRTALEKLAARFGANYYTNGGSIQSISRRHISEKIFRIVLRPKVRVLINRLYRRKSLLDKDLAIAMRQAKEAAEQLTRSSTPTQPVGPQQLLRTRRSLRRQRSSQLPLERRSTAEFTDHFSWTMSDPFLPSCTVRCLSCLSRSIACAMACG
jgi:hypothetical protein